MDFLRKAGVFLAASLLPLVLFSFGLGFSILQVYGQPDRIKNALETSNAYDTFISDMLSEARSSANGLGEGIPADRPEVKQIIENAVSPEYLKGQTEGFLDGIYAWVKGESKQLQLEINFTDARTRLADGLAQYAANRAASLPPCTTPVDPATFDAMNAECLPPGISPAAAAEIVRQEVNNEIFEDPVITQDDLKNDQGEPLQQQLQDVQGAYDGLVTGLWVSGILALLLAAAVILLSKPWRAGVKRAGIIFISVGALSAALAAVGAFLFKQLAESLAAEGSVQSSLANVASILANDFRTWWLGYGIILLVLGVGGLVALKFVKAGKEPGEPELSARPNDPEPDEFTKPAPKKSTKRTPPKKTI